MKPFMKLSTLVRPVWWLPVPGALLLLALGACQPREDKGAGNQPPAGQTAPAEPQQTTPPASEGSAVR